MRPSQSSTEVLLEGLPWIRFEKEGGVLSLVFSGELNSGLVGHLNDIFVQIQKGGHSKLRMDLARVKSIDHPFAAVLCYYMERFQKGGLETELVGATEPLKGLLEGLGPALGQGGALPEGEGESLIESVGETAFSLFSSLRDVFGFVGDSIIGLLKAPFLRSRAKRGLLTGALYHVGVAAIPIVSLISLLLGLVMAFMSAIQLERFGAQIYVAALLTVAMTRELGPIMTGIIVAGRSGSSFASEIGAMKVSEEVDALRSMGLDLFQFLVMPKMVATAIALPILSLFSQAAGILGGLMVANLIMNIPIYSYLEQVIQSIRLFDIWWGTLKCIVFGLLVSGIGCYTGFKVRKGAAAVGEVATASVVRGIFFIILFDSIFAIILVYS